MQFDTVLATSLVKVAGDCLVLGVSKKNLSDCLSYLPKAMQAVAKDHYALNATGKAGQVMLLSTKEMSAKRLMLLELGDQKPMKVKAWRENLSKLFAYLKAANIKKVALHLGAFEVEGHDRAWGVQDALVTCSRVCYEFNEFRSTKTKSLFNKVTILCPDKACLPHCKKAVKQAKAVANGMTLCRDLSNAPPNVCNSHFLLSEAKKLAAKSDKLKVSTVEEAKMKKLGMEAFLSVNAASANPGRLIIMEYCGGKKTEAPTVFVGKGITFDTGGTDIKSAAGMLTMKFDMGGASTLFGVIKACAELKLPINVTAVAAVAENMVNSHASRPSDIITTMLGKTVEILNTDAEGRLVLCDAMTYAQRFKPKKMITVATLTGAALAAFGHVHTALMSNDQALADTLLQASHQAEDRAWQLPLGEEYHDLFQSEFADFGNASLSRLAGTVTSACFLEHFAEKTTWAHLDIAGTANHGSGSNRATGRPVMMLMQYLFDQC